MKKIGSLIVLLIVAPSLALAGEIFGKVVEGSASVGEAASVEVKCGDKTYPAQKTDKSGSYHLVVAESGKCTLTVSYKKQSASLGIASYEDAVQYDVVLESKDGKLTARRK